MKLFSLAIASAAFPIKLVILECVEAKFIWNHLCWSHVLISLIDLKLYQKETPALVFSSEFCKILRTSRDNCSWMLIGVKLHIRNAHVFHTKGYLEWRLNLTKLYNFFFYKIFWIFEFYVSKKWTGDKKVVEKITFEYSWKV